MKRLFAAFALTVVGIFAVASIAGAAVSSPCGSRPAPAKPRPAPAKRETVIQEFRRDVLGQKVPIYTYKDGDALDDEATKYEATLMSGQE